MRNEEFWFASLRSAFIFECFGDTGQESYELVDVLVEAFVLFGGDVFCIMKQVDPVFGFISLFEGYHKLVLKISLRLGKL